MRFHLASDDRARSAAKTLRKNLFEYGIEASLGACQAAIAAALGYASWAELKAQAGLHPPSPFDHEVDEAARLDRRRRHAEAFMKALGLPPATAYPLVDRLALTASRLEGGPARERANLTVSDFLAACTVEVRPHGAGTAVIATMPAGRDIAMRFEAVFGGDGPYPSLRLGSWPMPAAAAGAFPPKADSSQDPDGDRWEDCLSVLGFAPGSRTRVVLKPSIYGFRGQVATDSELDQAVAGWGLLLREAGVRDLDRLFDRSVRTVFDSASARPMEGREAYETLRDAPGNARLRGLLAGFPLLAYELWLDPAIRSPDGPATGDDLVERLATTGLSCGRHGETGPLPRKLVLSMRDETGGGGRWRPSAVAATLRLARARGEHSWRWWSGERLDTYSALAEVFDHLQGMWAEGSLLDAIGQDRLDTLLDGPPWRVTDACKAVLDQPDLGEMAVETARVLGRAAGLISGFPVPVRGATRLKPAVQGPYLLGLLDEGSLDKALAKAMMIIARASLGRGVEAPYSGSATAA